MTSEVKMMNNQKMGELLLLLRKEQNMTQKEVADCLHVSDKTVSKWERGLGFPEVGLLKELSKLFMVNIEELLNGQLNEKKSFGGNIQRIKFYYCSICNNVMTSTGESSLICCGRKLSALKPQKADEAHGMNLEQVETENYMTLFHEMTKEHFISFIARVEFDRVTLIKLYPEQNAHIRLPLLRRGQLYAYCIQHGLMKY